jgi:hypothetical protein
VAEMSDKKYWFIILAISFFFGLLGVINTTKNKDVTPQEISEWQDGNGYKDCIWIGGHAYYGDHIENVAGENKYVVYRGYDILILPEKTIIRSTKNE